MQKLLFLLLLTLMTLLFSACEGGPSGDGTVTICTSNTIIGIYNTDEAARDISVEGDRAVVAMGSSGISVFDVTQKSNPVLLSRLYQSAYVYSARIHDKHIYTYLKKDTDAMYYLRIIDISDLDHPVTRYDMAMDKIETNIYEMKSNWIAFEGEYVHLLGQITGEGGDYHILDVSDKTNPLLLSSMDINGVCGTISVIHELVIRDTLAYIGSYKGLDIIDFSDRGNPVSLSDTQTPVGCYYKSFELNGDILYSGGGSNLYAFDIADPENPAYISSVYSENKYILVSEINGTAYALGTNGEISIVDVSDPSRLMDTTKDIDINTLSYRIVDDTGYVYAADNAGLKIIDTCIR